jgi:hypothetical protein
VASNHDPYCRSYGLLPSDLPRFCDCEWVDMIRADERERTNTVGGHRQIRDDGRADMCNDLRDEVEALPTYIASLRVGDPSVLQRERVLRRDDVLDLIDGGSDV